MADEKKISLSVIVKEVEFGNNHDFVIGDEEKVIPLLRLMCKEWSVTHADTTVRVVTTLNNATYYGKEKIPHYMMDRYIHPANISYNPTQDCLYQIIREQKMTVKDGNQNRKVLFIIHGCYGLIKYNKDFFYAINIARQYNINVVIVEKRYAYPHEHYFSVGLREHAFNTYFLSNTDRHSIQMLKRVKEISKAKMVKIFATAHTYVCFRKDKAFAFSL